MTAMTITRTTPLVEVECGTDHASIWIPKHGWACRYARGTKTHKPHECHFCNCYWMMRADTPPAERVCDNCGGPAVPTGNPSCAPGLNVVPDFLDGQ